MNPKTRLYKTLKGRLYRGGMRFFAPLVVLAAVAAVVTAGPAAASQGVRYGVLDDAWIRYGPGSLNQRLDRLDKLGIDLVRVNVAWNEVEPKKGVFDWTGYDAVIDGLHKRGIEPVLTLVSTPAWANDGRGTNWAPTTGASFAAFAANAAKEYPFVRRWLIWNEPNQRRWLQPTSPATYVSKLLNPAYAAIHRVHPNALVAGGATAPRASTGGVSPVAWIAGMAAAHARLDAYAHNPYPLTPAETPFTGGCDHCDTITMATLDRLLGNVKKSFGAKTRIWLTEFGYQTDPPDQFLGVSDKKQALFVGQAALRAYLAPKVDMLIQFLVQDEATSGRWQSGVLTVSGTPKPSYEALELPLAIESQHGLATKLWGQVRPGRGVQLYRLQEFRGGSWHTVGGTRRTNSQGFFTRLVRATPGSMFRLVQASTRVASPSLTVPVAP
jgi:hypothetical protein